MRVCFWEDDSSAQFSPLTLSRPVFELVCGRFSQRERIQRAWQLTEWGAILRPHLTAVYREAEPDARLNDEQWLNEGAILLLNGRWMPATLTQLPCQPHQSAWVGDEPVAIWLDADEWSQTESGDLKDRIRRLADIRKRVDAGGQLLERPWDLVDRNPRQLVDDYPLSTFYSQRFSRRGVERLGPESKLSVSPLANVEPFVVLDTRSGPITIEEGASIKSFTRIEGPCHIGRETHVFRGQLTAGTTIGPVCRVGGEIENTIMHGYANKYHVGFLGHSYICPWVNIGAQSGTSDLKFDYSDVRVPLDGDLVETNRKKVGSFIGDHTKTAVNSLFDTGSAVGVMAMVLPDGDLIPRHVPSFSRYWRGELLESWPLEKLFDIARTAMDRRGMEFSSTQEMLYRLLYAQTEDERRQAFERMARNSMNPHERRSDAA
ncbi:MAG: hypothetical protein HUJ26_12325 [Planctomycetaceae bacterium]|nr:hypothetical protein [Planctomycetaceae bacterium]